MGLLKIEGVTHWSIPVNDLTESEKFYGDLLGLKPLGRLGDSGMSCFNVGDHNILLCQRAETVDKSFVEDHNVHHSFTVSRRRWCKRVRFFTKGKSPSIGSTIAERVFSRAGNFISSIRLATGSNCAIRPGSRGCPNLHSKSSRAPERKLDCRRQTSSLFINSSVTRRAI